MDSIILGYRNTPLSTERCFLYGIKYHARGKWSMSSTAYPFNIKDLGWKLRAYSYTNDLHHVCKECNDTLNAQKEPLEYVTQDFKKRALNYV